MQRATPSRVRLTASLESFQLGRSAPSRVVVVTSTAAAVYSALVRTVGTSVLTCRKLALAVASHALKTVSLACGVITHSAPKRVAVASKRVCVMQPSRPKVENLAHQLCRQGLAIPLHAQ